MTPRTNQEWITALRTAASALDSPHGQADTALEDLRLLLLRSLRFALPSGVSEADLEDFVQEALIRILGKLDSFRGESRFITWAQKIAVHVAYTELRRRRWRDVSLEDVLAAAASEDFTPDFLATPDADPAHLAARRMVLATIERIITDDLTERQRQAMVAVVQGGMPLQEVADRMGTNRNAMYKLLHDARLRLQKRLKREDLTLDDVRSAFESG